MEGEREVWDVLTMAAGGLENSQARGDARWALRRAFARRGRKAETLNYERRSSRHAHTHPPSRPLATSVRHRPSLLDQGCERWKAGDWAPFQRAHPSHGRWGAMCSISDLESAESGAAVASSRGMLRVSLAARAA